MGNARKSEKPDSPVPPTMSEEIPEEPIAGSCFRWDKDGNKREFTPEEYAATPRGNIFIGIGGFKPPDGKTYKPDPIRSPSDLYEQPEESQSKSIAAQSEIDHQKWSDQVAQELVDNLNKNVLSKQAKS